MIVWPQSELLTGVWECEIKMNIGEHKMLISAHLNATIFWLLEHTIKRDNPGGMA